MYILAICAASTLIVSFFALKVVTQGWGSLISDGGSFVAGLIYWVTAGVFAGVALGKIDAVVDIINHERRNNFTPLEAIIVGTSCHNWGPGRVVQAQITNLWSGIFGFGLTYVLFQMFYAVTGNLEMLGNYPGTTLMVIPFVIAWKLTENWTRKLFVSNHFRQTQPSQN